MKRSAAKLTRAVLKEKASTASTSTKRVKNTEESSARPCKIVSWNVAGVRAWTKKGGHEFLLSLDPDFILLQELKANTLPVEEHFKDYHIHIAPSQKVNNNVSPYNHGNGPKFRAHAHFHGYPRNQKLQTGHGGVALLSKSKPVSVTIGIGDERFDSTGRLITAEFSTFYIICAYVPNSGRGLVNLANRKIWDQLFLEKITTLDKHKPVLYVGDLNVAHQEIDLANPKSNRNKTAGFTDQERDDFSRLLDAGFVDIFRHRNPALTGAYTFWSYMHNARASNIGWRLDYFLANAQLLDNVIDCRHHSEVMGSDHCPLSIEIKL